MSPLKWERTHFAYEQDISNKLEQTLSENHFYGKCISRLKKKLKQKQKTPLNFYIK